MEPNSDDQRPSEGRFSRIEYKLDGLIDDFANFRVDVTGRLVRLEAGRETDKVQGAERVSDRSFYWMKVGIVSSIVVGIGSVVLRFVGI